MSAFEDDVRAMLARRAADVHPVRPPLPRLDRRPNLVLVESPDHDGPERRPARRDPRRRRWAPALAVAAALAVLVGAVGILRALDSTGPGGPADGPADTAADVTTPGPAPLGDDARRFPAPGEEGFGDPDDTFTVWPSEPDEPGLVDVDRTDPEAVAAAYVDTVVAPGGGSIGLVAGTTSVAGRTATVAWEAPAAADRPAGVPAGGQGLVHLVQAATDDGTWSVTGASADPPTLGDVRTDGDVLQFRVWSAMGGDGGTMEMAVRVEVDGEPVPLGGRPYTGDGTASGGDEPTHDGRATGTEVLDVPTDGGMVLSVDVAPQQFVSILVRHPGDSPSATAMALYPPSP